LSSNLSSNTPHKCYYPHTSHTITLSLFNVEFTTHLPSVCNNCVQSGIQITYFFFSFFLFFQNSTFLLTLPSPPTPLYYKKYLKPLLAEFPLKLIFSRQLDSICRSVHFPEAYVSDISKEIIISYILSYLVINIQIYLGYILNYYSELDADSINILLVVHILFLVICIYLMQ
jgi:hypothetical protein